ncbi:class I SAM-dependent methyltransferase [Natrarchaeobius chitinivorans]|uniref:Class I SAM-dependent methyltransferase n=1 Tax=Natrarchaeobius chitinivorans TaxID=1679083 RepID=A0A3N6M7W9_NATCH|nr:class I SAM-dependent methyltransferase [Natrarchaeobius chitinivorans]RQG92270.1 class I SAM-dependent methyltransferase [Natrarchaeobius chitinivorans]
MTDDERRSVRGPADERTTGSPRDGSSPLPSASSEHEPSPILRGLVTDLPPGRALDVATGLGRNAICLADAGWTVDALDVSRGQLVRARERAESRSVTVEWILADVDSYAFLEGTYDAVTISFFDARSRFPSVKAALAPGGILFYEHYLESPAGQEGPGDRYRFASNELLTACSDLTVLYYVERRIDGEPRVTLVARNGTDGGDSRALLPL